METRPMTEMEERLMTQFMQANRERDEARAERDEALESSRRWEAEVMLYAANRDYQRGKREEAEAQVQTLRETLEAIASNRIGGQQ